MPEPLNHRALSSIECTASGRAAGTRKHKWSDQPLLAKGIALPTSPLLKLFWVTFPSLVLGYHHGRWDHAKATPSGITTTLVPIFGQDLHAKRPRHSLKRHETVDATQVGFESGDEEVTPVTWAIAVMLFGFLLVNTSCLYLIHIQDENIRSYIYKMISTTISIFCAVLMNQAVFSFILKQILPSPFPRGFGMHVGIREKLVVGILLFSISWFLINASCAYFKHKKAYLYAVTNIGAHLCAFAGIFTFGEFQQEPMIRYSIPRAFSVYLFANGMVFLFRYASEKLRSWPTFLESFSEYQSLGSSGTPESGIASSTDEVEEWIESAMEAEDEAVILVLSFLAHQCILFKVAGEMPNMEGEESAYGEWEVGSLLSIALLFLICLICATSVRSSRKSQGRYVRRLVNNTHNFIAMSMSWCVQNMGIWQMNLWLKEKHLAGVLNAFVMTALSVLIIIVLDQIADKLLEGDLSVDGAQNHARRVASRLPTRSATVRSTAARSSSRAFFLRALSIQDIRERQAFEEAIRKIIASFGLLVGLSWERAFDVATVTIVHGMNIMKEHPVFSRMILAFAIVLFILPAWLRFIVPMAQADEEELRETINREIELERATSENQ